MQIAREVLLAYAGGEIAERLESQSILHPAQGIALAQKVVGRPRRLRCPLARGVQDAKAGLAQVGQSFARLFVSFGQQIAKEVKGRFRRKLLAGRGENTLPERLGRALLAVAEEGPAHMGLVVL